MTRLVKHLAWFVVAVIGAVALSVVALRRGEAVNALWIVVAAVAIYLVAYRYYSLFIAKHVMQIDPLRATPAVLNNDGLDYVPTNKHVLFGHHFAAIAGAGPLVGPLPGQTPKNLDVKNNNPSSRWLPLALALAVNAAMPLAYAEQAPASIHIQAQPLGEALSQLGQPGRRGESDRANGLNPEKAKTYEIGTRYDEDAWGGEVTLFYIDFDEELQYVSNDVGWTNLGATKHQGLEASVHYDLAALDPRLDGLTANAGFTYTRATNEGDIPGFKGSDLPFYSRQVATLGLRYDINRWTYNLDAFAQSRQHAPGTGINSDGSFSGNYITEGTADGQYGDMPGYVTWNVRGGYDFGSQLSNLKVGAGVKNLFDRQYFTRSSDNNSGIYVGAPRTFFVQASVGF